MESLRGHRPLIYDSFTGQIWGQNFLWGSKGGSAPLKGRENKGPHSGPKYGVIKGASPP
jgi:hypothetical protein